MNLFWSLDEYLWARPYWILFLRDRRDKLEGSRCGTSIQFSLEAMAHG
jgi:hypothetical protein